MEKRDEELIAALISQDEELRALVKEHREFERCLEEFNSMSYMTAKDAQEKKRIQKQKLAGRDKIEIILGRHRKSQDKQ
ncbi:MAG: DUF465 domain-containing protein [Thermodesulfobacteriota bacterium]|nr:DUF465 domain-containing protein [Thermodesulfobacteriota bacterium]